MSRRRIGVLGGTFDPVHNGHLAVARQVRQLVDLDRVVFVPAGTPWQKQAIASAEDRLAMLRLALEGEADCEVSLVDVLRPGPTYTVDTLSDLATEYPGDELWFILGADAARGVPTWHRSEDLLEHARFVIVSRPGEPEPQAPDGMRHLELVRIPSEDVSSSMCRNRARAGESLTGLVPDAVQTYITDHRLYEE